MSSYGFLPVTFFYLSGSLLLIGLDFISVFGGTPRGLAQMTSAERGEKGGCSKSYSRKRGYMDLVLTRGEGCQLTSFVNGTAAGF